MFELHYSVDWSKLNDDDDDDLSIYSAQKELTLLRLV